MICFHVTFFASLITIVSPSIPFVGTLFLTLLFAGATESLFYLNDEGMGCDSKSTVHRYLGKEDCDACEPWLPIPHLILDAPIALYHHAKPIPQLQDVYHLRFANVGRCLAAGCVRSPESS